MASVPEHLCLSVRSLANSLASLSPQVPDLFKGSYYNNPTIDQPVVSDEDLKNHPYVRCSASPPPSFGPSSTDTLRSSPVLPW